MKSIIMSKQQVNLLKKDNSGFNVTASHIPNDISGQVFRQWNISYSRSEESDTEQIKKLEEEIYHLKAIILELTQENRALNWIIEKRVNSISSFER